MNKELIMTELLSTMQPEASFVCHVTANDRVLLE